MLGGLRAQNPGFYNRNVRAQVYMHYQHSCDVAQLTIPAYHGDAASGLQIHTHTCKHSHSTLESLPFLPAPVVLQLVSSHTNL